jgi:5-methylthioadenosine/S-adenosylhomocysteine deaminase
MVTLAHGSTVIQSADRVIADGAVAFEGERIEAVGPFEELRRRWPDADIIGGPAKLVMPGLANAHDHGRGVSTWDRGLVDDALETWRLEQQRTRPLDPYNLALFYALQMLRTGVTTVVHMHLAGMPPGRLSASAGGALRAYLDAGLRVCFAVGVWDQQRIVLGPDEPFIASLPPSLRAEVRSRWGEMVGLDETLAVARELTQEARDTRARVYLGPLAAHWCSQPLLKALKQEADRLETGIHMHLLETPYQKVWADRALGRPLVEALDEWGLIDEHFTGAHAVWLTDAEMDLLARRGAAISHDPSSNLRLRSGIARVPTLLAKGVTTGIGLDGMGFREPDLFAEMRLALVLGRPPGIETPALDGRGVFRLATEGGTRTALHRDDLGTLEPGRPADLVILDAAELAAPLPAARHDPIDQLIWRGRPEHVETVVIAGEVVLENGQPTRASLSDVAARLNAEIEAVNAADTDDGAWFRELETHVTRFYANWQLPATDWGNLR